MFDWAVTVAQNLWISIGLREGVPGRFIPDYENEDGSLEVDRLRLVSGLSVLLESVPPHHRGEADQEGQQPAESHDEHHPAFFHTQGVAAQ